jgi:homoaconitase/3-isopropylmalate dehydratase large subunit
LGNAIWVVFNLAPANIVRGIGGQQIAESAEHAILFCKEVAEALKRAEMQFRMGIAAEASARAGMISQDRLLFDLYSQAMATAANLARQATPGKALIQQNVARFDKSSQLPVVRIQSGDGKDDMVCEMDL